MKKFFSPKKTLLFLIYIVILFVLSIFFLLTGWVGAMVLMAVFVMPVPIGAFFVAVFHSLLIRALWGPLNISKIIFSLIFPIILLVTGMWLGGILERLILLVPKQHSMQVVTALDHYKTDHQTYPEKLEELVPTYLRQIPAFDPYFSVRLLYSGGGKGYMLRLSNDFINYCYKSDPSGKDEQYKRKLRMRIDCIYYADNIL